MEKAENKKPIDIRNMTPQDLLNLLMSKKVVFASLIIIVVGFLVIFVFINNYARSKDQIQAQMNEMQAKLGVIATYRSSKTQFEEFQNTLPKGVGDDVMVDAISDVAISSNVEIKSFSKVNVVPSQYYDLASVDVSIFLKDYKDLIGFMQALETSKVAFLIDTYRVEGVSEDGVTVSMKISTIKTKIKI